MASDDSRVRGLQTFLGKGGIKQELPRVTIQAKGVFGLNQASFVALGEPEAVEFLYDSEQEIIGIRSGLIEAAHTYQVHPTSSAHSYTVAGKAFLKFHEIPFGRSTRYAAELVDGILIIELGKGGEPASRGRSIYDYGFQEEPF